MNILIINSDIGNSIAGRVADDLCRTMREHGQKCMLGYSREQTARAQNVRSAHGDNPDAVRIGTRCSVVLHMLKTRLFDAEGFGSKQATKRFLAAAEKFAPDIIHLHNLHGSYIHLPLLFKWLNEKDKPVVWTLHDCWGFTGHCTDYTHPPCDKWKIGCFKCPQKHVYPKSWLLDRSSSHFFMKRNIVTSLQKLTLVTASQWLSDQVTSSYLSKYTRYVIPNSINHPAFKTYNKAVDFNQYFDLYQDIMKKDAPCTPVNEPRELSY